jgi:hypothetical protein
VSNIGNSPDLSKVNLDIAQWACVRAEVHLAGRKGFQQETKDHLRWLQQQQAILARATNDLQLLIREHDVESKSAECLARLDEIRTSIAAELEWQLKDTQEELGEVVAHRPKSGDTLVYALADIMLATGWSASRSASYIVDLVEQTWEWLRETPSRPRRTGFMDWVQPYIALSADDIDRLWGGWRDRDIRKHKMAESLRVRYQQSQKISQ